MCRAAVQPRRLTSAAPSPEVPCLLPYPCAACPRPLSSRCAVEADGPNHFTLSAPPCPLGRTLARWRCLEARGYRVVSVPWHAWRALRTGAASAAASAAAPRAASAGGPAATGAAGGAGRQSSRAGGTTAAKPAGCSLEAGNDASGDGGGGSGGGDEAHKALRAARMDYLRGLLDGAPLTYVAQLSPGGGEVAEEVGDEPQPVLDGGGGGGPESGAQQ